MNRSLQKLIIAVSIITLMGVSPGLLAKKKKFSFIVFGDTRPESILYGCDLSGDILQILQDRYGSSTKFIYHAKPNQKIDNCLEKIEVVEKDKTTMLHYNFKAVPQKIIQTKKGKSRMLFSFKGWRSVSEGITQDIASKKKHSPIFAIHGGDMVLNGFQGQMYSPYWMLFNSFYGSLRVREPGSMPRFFPAVGNHELWEDENLVGFRYWFPWLKTYGFTENNRLYHFIHQNSLFVFLDSGDYAETGGTQWLSKLPAFQGQMDFLKKQLDNSPKSVKHVFVVYHKPSFVQVGHDPLPKDQNPHYAVLKDYADKFNIVVFNSHVHSTEYYLVDGIHYLVVGGGGAPQAFKPADHPSPEKELYWNGKPPTFQLNFMTVHVKGKKVSVDVNKFLPPAFKREKPVQVFSIK